MTHENTTVLSEENGKDSLADAKSQEERGDAPRPEAVATQAPFLSTLRSAAVRTWKAVLSLSRSLFVSIWRTAVGVCATVEKWLLEEKHASYGLAVARILLGTMIFGMVVLSNWSTLTYTFGPGAAWTGQLGNPGSDFATIFPMSLVNQAAHSALGITLVAVALALLSILFTLGYRTRLVMLPLAVLWVGFLSINDYVQDQSDNLTRISFVAFLFAALSDRWSLDAKRRIKYAGSHGNVFLRWWRFQKVLPSWMTHLSHNLALVVIICQLCFVYASGGLFKAGGVPWQDGTAVYDPLSTIRFGTWPELTDIVTFWGPGVAIFTIGTVLVQSAFPLAMLNRFSRIAALIAILFFHLGIAVLMGLPWFSLSMIALDAVFIRDVTWQKLGIRLRKFSYDARGRTPGVEPDKAADADHGAEKDAGCESTALARDDDDAASQTGASVALPAAP